MRIEKNYFSNRKQSQNIQRQMQDLPQVGMSLNPEEEAHIQAMVDKAMAALEKNTQTDMDNAEMNRNTKFFAIANKIVPVAEWFPMDLLLEAHKKDTGRIRLRTDHITIDEYCPNEIRHAFWEVLAAADEIHITNKAGLIEVMMYFQRFDF